MTRTRGEGEVSPAPEAGLATGAMAAAGGAAVGRSSGAAAGVGARVAELGAAGREGGEDGGAGWEAGDPPPVSSGAVWAITNGTAAKGMEKRAGRAKKVRRGWRGMDRCRGRSAAVKPKLIVVHGRRIDDGRGPHRVATTTAAPPLLASEATQDAEAASSVQEPQPPVGGQAKGPPEFALQLQGAQGQQQPLRSGTHRFGPTR